MSQDSRLNTNLKKNDKDLLITIFNSYIPNSQSMKFPDIIHQLILIFILQH